jgi:uncharacterized protein
MSWDTEAFKEKLEQEHSFPGTYIFKFIVPTERTQQVERLVTEGKIGMRVSGKGNYTSVTIEKHIGQVDEIVDIYLEASKIEGCIAL